jgi:hypothetical protein
MNLFVNFQLEHDLPFQIQLPLHFIIIANNNSTAFDITADVDVGHVTAALFTLTFSFDSTQESTAKTFFNREERKERKGNSKAF